jgi:putative transposase
MRVHAYCVMPDHLHVVCSVMEAGGDLERWVCRAKSGASRRAGLPLWQRSYWDRTARLADDVAVVVGYVLANPVRRGLWQDWSEWPWSWSEWDPDSG